jgi:surface protein
MDVTILTYLDTFLEESQKRSFIKSLYDFLSDSERVEFLDILPANMIRYTIPSFQDELEIMENDEEDMILPGGTGVMREPSDTDSDTPYIIGSKQFENFNELQQALMNWDRNKDSLIAKYGPIKDWDVTLVTNMSALFSMNEDFNEDISGWDVSNVTDMSYMFHFSNFNQDISGWDVSNVKSMENMFGGSTRFNQPLQQWGSKLSNVTDMNNMFSARNFNQDISSWDVSSVESMFSMFYESNFNQDISSWDVSSVIDMERMFYESNFNNGGNPEGLNNWDVSSVIDTVGMFDGTVIEIQGHLPRWYIGETSQMHPDYPYLHEKVNLQELPNVSPITLENIPPTCYDFIEGDVDSIEYINEDENNAAFIYGSEGNYNTTCMSRGDLKTMLSDSTGNNLFYKCVYPDTLRDINTTQTYFKFALITGVIFIPAEYMVSVIENTEHDLFLVVCSGEEIEYSVGYTYYHNLGPEAGVSTWHCNPGSNLPLCTLTPISF